MESARPYLDGAGGELDADGGLGVEGEGVAGEAAEEVGLAHARVPDQHHLEQVVVLVPGLLPRRRPPPRHRRPIDRNLPRASSPLSPAPRLGCACARANWLAAYSSLGSFACLAVVFSSGSSRLGCVFFLWRLACQQLAVVFSSGREDGARRSACASERNGTVTPCLHLSFWFISTADSVLNEHFYT
jgi:hypothetical protein